MKRWNYSKKLMTAVCLMFAGSVSGSSLTYCYTTKSNFGSASGTHCHATGGKDIDDFCSTCADKFIW